MMSCLMRRIFKRVILMSAVGMSLLVNRHATAEDVAPIYTKLIVIGDSITNHGPVEKLGWSGQWGMAASSQDKDYVHLFLARLTKAQNGTEPKLMIEAEGGGKLTDRLAHLSRIKEFGADLAIVQMGENDNTNVTIDGFQKPYEQILAGLREGNPNVRIFCFGNWSPPNGNAQKDAMIRNACKNYGATFVSLAAVNADPLNKAGAENRFTHPGVNWHPGDKGMRGYADALWSSFVGKAEEPKKDALLESKDNDVVFTEAWNTASGLIWNPTPKIEVVDGHPVLTVTSAEAGKHLLYQTSLTTEKIKGRTLTVETRIKGNSVSIKPNNWSGIRIGLKLQNAEGEVSYPQTHVGEGTFDWTAVKWTYRIPDNVIAASLLLGLENVTGTVEFDAVKVSLQP